MLGGLTRGSLRLVAERKTDCPGCDASFDVLPLLLLYHLRISLPYPTLLPQLPFNVTPSTRVSTFWELRSLGPLSPVE